MRFRLFAFLSVLVGFTGVSHAFTADNHPMYPGGTQNTTNNITADNALNNTPNNTSEASTPPNITANPYSKNPYSNTDRIAANSTPNALSSSSINLQQAQEVWFAHCIPSIKNTQVAPYAQAYCQCGWSHIQKGELPLQLLTSTLPADVQKANRILKVISQMCQAEVMQAK